MLNPLHRLGWGEWLLIGVFLLTVPLVNPYVRGDGNGYYAYIRSLVIDGDLQFENEYRRGDPAFIGMAFDADGQLRPEMVMPTHYVRNQWAVGPSLLWTPFFLLAHGLVRILNEMALNIPADGYAQPYRWLCALGTALFAFIGLLLACRLAEQFTSPLFAVMATVGIWFATPLPVYMYFLPFHVHALAAFTVSLFVWYWLRTRPQRTLKQWGLWGLVGGLVVEVYHINAIFLLIPLSEWLWSGNESGVLRVKEARMRRRVVTKGLVFAVAGLAALIPHFLVKWVIEGSPFSTGYGDRFFWDSPRLWQVGFAAEHGMFLWTPVLLLAVVGMVLLWRRDRWAAGILLVTFSAFYYAIASYENWHGQSAFGSRFFVSFTPVFVLGLAVFLEQSGLFLSRFLWGSTTAARQFWNSSLRWLRPLLLLTILVVWNVGFIFQWGANLVPNRGPVDFAQVARHQVTVVPQRMADFLTRYLRDREQVVREVEREDLIESKDYRLRR